MIVKEALNKYQGQKIRLGANKGSSFIYIGICDKTMDDYINRAERETIKFYHKKNSSQEKKYVPVLERDIIDIYGSCYEPDVTIIIYNGAEKGKYWLEPESKAKNVNEEDQKEETYFEKLKREYTRKGKRRL